jgi:hypothetical protein
MEHFRLEIGLKLTRPQELQERGHRSKVRKAIILPHNILEFYLYMQAAPMQANPFLVILASTSSASVKFTVGSFPSSLSHACRQTTPSSLGLIPATRLKPANELHPKREFVRVVY